jgi:hypothetical protein
MFNYVGNTALITGASDRRLSAHALSSRLRGEQSVCAFVQPGTVGGVP